ncbi:hypothetical protein [Methylomonas albis]|uniref:Glycosyltransferase family 39 protein n=1 Tax=Methylomonas albis TaxID=1854563 RepID=A0ABR9DA26_9GAMM|nr:glycosyltransferase family 39 protein [Methylomonas albis]MBD9358747.1 glycosyltransferase family 39 protein [Methylomonas albis]CAD6882200.1 hypothetical protein [Methylomonas albis]
MLAVKIDNLNIFLKRNADFALAGNRDTRQLIGFLLVYWLAWTITVAILSESIVLDSVEQVIWSQTWQWGYYKHPPLPSILMAGLNWLLNGPSIGLTIFAAQGCTVIALIYVWRLARKMLPLHLAITAVLLTSLIGYHNYKPTSFDHNTVSLPFSAAVLYYFYRAIHEPQRILNWLTLGLVAGLAMLTKYSALLVIAGPFVYLIWQNIWSNPFIIRGLFISASIFTLVLFPHVLWLSHHNWLPFSYFYGELNLLNSRFDILGRFFIGQMLPFLPFFIGFFWIRKLSVKQSMPTEVLYINHRDSDWRFLMATLITPNLLALLPTLLNGSFLSRDWVSAFFLPSGILIVKCFFDKYNHQRILANTRHIVWSCQITILLLFAIGKIIYPKVAGLDVRTNFPGKLLAERVSEIWQQHQGQPLNIVIADTWLAGNLLLHTRPEPTALLNNDLSISTWLTQQDLKNCGAMVLTTIETRDSSNYSEVFNHAMAAGSFSLLWGNLPHDYAWAILSPESDAKNCRLNHG